MSAGPAKSTLVHSPQGIAAVPVRSPQDSLKIGPTTFGGETEAVTGTADLYASIAAAVLALGALLTVRGRLTRERGLRGELVAYFGVAAVAALVCAVMNIFELAGGGPISAAVGNATNVLAPGILWAGARRVNGRSRIGILSAVAASLLILAITFVVTADAATLLKTAAIAAFCVLGATEMRVGRLRQLPGTLTMAIALLVFAAYNLARIVLAATAGIGSWAWNTFASAEFTSLASAGVILAVGIGAVRTGRRLLDDPEPGTRAHARRRFRDDAESMLAAHRHVVGVRVQIRDLPLIRAAHGAAHADAVLAAVERAAREALPGAATGILARDTVGALAAEADADLERALRERFAALARGTGVDADDLRITRGGVDVSGVDAFFAAGV